MRTAAAGLVHGVVLVHPAEFAWDLVDVGDHVVAGNHDVMGDVSGKGAVASAHQQLGAAVHPAVPVQRYHDVDVIEEGRKLV